MINAISAILGFVTGLFGLIALWCAVSYHQKGDYTKDVFWAVMGLAMIVLSKGIG